MEITEVQREILKHAGDLFFRYGIKSVSIDDICREMAMSKKTFYQHFSTKDELVEAMLNRNFEKMDSCLRETLEGKPFAKLIEGFVSYQQSSREDLRRVPTLVYDLQKYYPSQFASFQLRTFESQKQVLTSVFLRGIEEGYVRENIDVDLTAIFFAKVHNDAIRDIEMLQTHDINVGQISRQALEIMVRGILTRKGLDAMENDKNS